MPDYSPSKNDCTSQIKQSKKKVLELTALLTKTKESGQAKFVEEIAIEETKIHLWKKGYWILREQQQKGPADLYAYKIIENKIIDYFIDAKGIHPRVNYRPQFKRRVSSKFHERDTVLNKIQAIFYRGKLVFKDINNKELKIL